MKKSLLQNITNFIFPPRCIGCKSWDTWLCEHCAESIQIRQASHCLYCINTLHEYHHGELICQSCLHKYQFTQIFSYSTFSDLLQKIIQQYKYEFITELHVPLSSMFTHYLTTTFPHIFTSPDKNLCVVPIPLHDNRQSWRGFNQSELIAQYIEKKTTIPVYNALIRSKETKAQMQLTRKERFINIETSFSINPDINHFALLGKSILLIDDVATTGATIQACAKTLLPYTNQICGIVLAHGA